MNKAYKYLGVHIQADRCMASQYNALLAKSNQTGVCNAYFTVYLPAIMYSLKASSLKVEELEKIQSKVTQTFLNKMGYH